jgi:hypothetical protein
MLMKPSLALRLTCSHRLLWRAVVFSVVWIAAYLMIFRGDTTSQRDSVDRLLEESREVSTLDTVVTDAASDLPGKLLFLEQRGQPNYRIAFLDFETQSLSTAFAIPEKALVYQLAETPVPDTLLMTYSAPPEAGHQPYDRNGIYTLDLKRGEVELLLGDDVTDVYYAYPQWSGDFLYYAVYERANATQRIERFDLQEQTTMMIAPRATLPVASPDGSFVAYLALNPHTGRRSIRVADAEGQHTVELVGEYTFSDIDLPMFSGDGQWVYFTVLDMPAPSLLSILVGSSRAYAHGNHLVPARWYRVPATGGQAEIVTSNPDVTLFGSLYGDLLGYVSSTGFSVIRDQGAQQIVQSRAMRSFVWLP